jgi:hypothetical protein
MIWVSLSSLIRSIKLDVKPRRNPKPLIVLNACGASTIDPTNSVSFPSLFLENHNPGVLGTEIVIPDRVATAFSKAFYTKLLSGATLGESVLHARRQLWEEHSNPLGLTYSLYGNADLQVTTPKETP